MDSNFWFLKEQWPSLYKFATKAERLVKCDPRTSSIFSRCAVEHLVVMYNEKLTGIQRRPREGFGRYLHSTGLSTKIPPLFYNKINEVAKTGNVALHQPEDIRQGQAFASNKTLFDIAGWFAKEYDAQTFSSIPSYSENLLQTEYHLTERLFSDVRSDVPANIRPEDYWSFPDDDACEDEEFNIRRIVDILLLKAGWNLSSGNDVLRDKTVQGIGDEHTFDMLISEDENTFLAVVEFRLSSQNLTDGFALAKECVGGNEKYLQCRPGIICFDGCDVYICGRNEDLPAEPVDYIPSREELVEIMK